MMCAHDLLLMPFSPEYSKPYRLLLTEVVVGYFSISRSISKSSSGISVSCDIHILPFGQLISPPLKYPPKVSM